MEPSAGLAIDVAVICPLAASHLRSSEPCESYAKSEKIDRYAPAFVNSDYDFVPVVFETSGAVNKEGETVKTVWGPEDAKRFLSRTPNSVLGRS